MGYHTCHGVVMEKPTDPTPSHQVVVPNDDEGHLHQESLQKVGQPKALRILRSWQIQWLLAINFERSLPQVLPTSENYKSFFSWVSPPKTKKTYSTKEEFFNTDERVSVLTNVKSTVFVGTTIPGDQQTMESPWISRCSNDFCSQFLGNDDQR